MKPLSGLFNPIPFLIRYPIYHQRFYPDEFYTLQLRPFSIMEDISPIYNWINKPRLLHCGQVKTYQRNMLKHYKSLLDSSDSQALMVIKDGRAVCQFDLFPASTDPVHTRISNGIHDVSVKYMADFRIPPRLFRDSLHLCLDYIFTFSEDPEVFTSLLPIGIIGENEFTSVGCKFIDGLPFEQDIVKVYSCNRYELTPV